MLKLYSTEKKKLIAFKPLKGKTVTLYHCGPTLYWTQHIGNLRGVVMADLIVRALEYAGYTVKLVRNYTDVGHLVSDDDGGEDKMAKGAQREGLSPEQIAAKYRAVFEHDIAALNVLPALATPMATEYISAMQDMVQVLLKKGYAYATDLAIYYDVTKAKKYTRLSGQNLDMNRTGAGKGEVGDPQKKHPADFALWFFKAGTHAQALQTWRSPFFSPLVANGQGFPGWHIECSAMIKELLGLTIDIHMGGIEHIPVHHTNEIAQSESANGKPFVRYWLHNEHLLVDGKKMSKSEGTSYTLADVTARGFDPLDLRYFFLQSQYRSKQNFTWEALEAAKKGRAHIENQIRNLKSEILNKSQITNNKSRTWDKKFVAALADDCNIPAALGLVSEMLKDVKLAPEQKLATIAAWDTVFGLDVLKSQTVQVSDEVSDLVRQRDTARAQKDWKRSDELREQLGTLGYAVEDTPTGTRIVKK